ncbi:hypothetical protein BST61_g8694 [Cercospora zeina]
MANEDSNVIGSLDTSLENVPDGQHGPRLSSDPINSSVRERQPRPQPSYESNFSSTTEKRLLSPDCKPPGVERPPPTVPKGLQLSLLVFALFMSVLIAAITQTVLASAIPTITTAFEATIDVSWYTTAEGVTAVAFLLPLGRAYSLLNNKWVFLASMVVLLLGTIVCGVAQTSTTLISGRAVQGVGCAGVIDGVYIIMARIAPLQRRALYAGIFGAAYAIASASMPVVGGLLTLHLSWRYCFFVILPLGALALVITIFCIPSSLARSSGELRNLGWKQRILRFDPLGTLLLLSSLTFLTLGLQLGGIKHPWDSAECVGILTAFAVTFLAWLALQYFQADDATVPLSLITQRSIAGTNLYTLTLQVSFAVFVAFLPIWLQSIRGDDPEHSGLAQLALCISAILGSIGVGVLVMLLGYYNPFLILGSLLAVAGSALLVKIEPSTHIGVLIGAQILMGAGVGMGSEQANVATQNVLAEKDIAKGTSLVLLTRQLGFTVGVPAAQSIMQQTLMNRLGPQLTQRLLTEAGATEMVSIVRDTFPAHSAEFEAALAGVNRSFRNVFLFAVISAAVSVVFASLVEWKSVKRAEGSVTQERNTTSID